MQIKQTLAKIHFLAITGFFSVVGLLFVITSNAPSVFADTKFGDWCTGVGNLDDNLTAPCYNSVFKALEGHGVKGDTASQRIKACGAIRDGNEGECANALIACYNTLLDKTKCADDKLVADISYTCNGGRINPNQGSNQDECDNIATANNDTIRDIERRYASAYEACRNDALAKGDLNKVSECDKAAASVGGTCARAAGLPMSEAGGRQGPITQGWGPGGNLDGDNSDYVGVGSRTNIAQYDKCIRDESLKKAQDNEVLCKGIPGAIYINKDTKDPNGPNTLDKGCYSQDSDLDNPEACALGAKSSGRDLVWQKTNKPGEPEAWGCEDRNDADNDSQDDEDQPGTGAGGRRESFENCGEAETVLIKCDINQSGAPVIAEVLRIGIFVLTIIIGVSAVGGIAWAATLYAKAEDNSSSVTEARTLIRNIVIGLLVYGFMVVIVNWLIPGGVIG